MRYMLSRILKAHFPEALSRQKKSLLDSRVLPKYNAFKAPLREIQCPLEKADLLPLPVLDIDKSSISGTIDILKTYLKRLGLEDCVVGGKKIMFRGNFLTVRNITRAIYQGQIEVQPIDCFEFIEPIAGFLHLQMNVLKLFFSAIWGKVSNRISFACFQTVLKRKGAAKNVKDFHASNDFFCTVVRAFAVAVYMHGAFCTQLPAFPNWLSANNWRALIASVSEDHIDPFKPCELCAKARSKVEEKVAHAVAVEKAKWQNKRDQDRAVGITTTWLKPPNWKKEQTDRVEKALTERRDIVNKNALIMLNTGLLYLDFADACREGYSARVKKCIKCFAVLFQDSYAKNYAGEILHLTACLRKLWKPEFKYVNAV